MDTFLLVLLSICCDLFTAFTISMLWLWFIMPINHLIPYISIFHFAGILILGNLVVKKNKDFKLDDEVNWQLLVNVFIYNITTLVLGIIYHLLMK